MKKEKEYTGSIIRYGADPLLTHCIDESEIVEFRKNGSLIHICAQKDGTISIREVGRAQPDLIITPGGYSTIYVKGGKE